MFVIKRLVITIDVMRQTACLVVNPFNVNIALLTSLIARQ